MNGNFDQIVNELSTLLKFNSAQSQAEKGMPFGMIPAEYMAEIESEFQKKLTFTI